MDKQKKPKKLIISIIIFVIGIITLAVGVVFLLINLLQKTGLQDGEYLVSAYEWVLDDWSHCAPTDTGEGERDDTARCLPSVIWEFTEIGKGKLTTNGHINDYDFAWAIRDDKLIVETKWLYTFDNEYDYELDQENGILTLTDGDTEYRLIGSFENQE